MTATGEAFVTETNRRLEGMESAVAAQPDGNVTVNRLTNMETMVKAIEDRINNMVTSDTLEIILNAKLSTMQLIYLKASQTSNALQN